MASVGQFRTLLILPNTEKVRRFNSNTAYFAAMEEPDLLIGRLAPADRELGPAQADADA
jgi:hypothetical protein